jgi:quinol-cytochrome oxidoreductase complex cytochrome b subunit
MNAYIISIVVAIIVLLIAALISNAIKFEGGAHPKDPGKRKMAFWILMILAPVLTYVLGALIFAPDESVNQIEHDEFMSALSIAVGVSLVVYIILGFVLSKAMKNGKIGHWF